jgi:hypothetical protein
MFNGAHYRDPALDSRGSERLSLAPWHQVGNYAWLFEPQIEVRRKVSSAEIVETIPDNRSKIARLIPYISTFRKAVCS